MTHTPVRRRFMGKRLQPWQLARFINGDMTVPLLPMVYCAHAWDAKRQCWILLGFVHVKRMRVMLKDLERYRRRFTLPAHVPFKMTELFILAEFGPPAELPPRGIYSFRNF